MREVRDGISYEDAAYLVEKARQKSRFEMEVLGVDPYLAADTMADAPISKTIYCDGKPAAGVGAFKSGGEWQVFGVSTNDWDHVWRLVTLVIVKDMLVRLKDKSAKRAVCLSPAAHKDTHKWLRFLGFRRSDGKVIAGVDGEPLLRFEWTKD